jgi:MFS family permease
VGELWGRRRARVTGQRQRRGIGIGFGRLWTASTAGNLGDGVARVAIPLLAVQLTRDPFAVGLVTALTYLPWLVFGLLAGALVDRHDRRRLAALAAVVRIGALAVLAISASLDAATMMLLYAVVVVLYTCETLYDSSLISIVPMVVTERGDLERANGRIEGARLIADRFVGPPLASLLFAVAAGYAFGVNMACYALAAILLATLPGSYRAARSRPPAASRPSTRAAVRVGTTTTSMFREVGAGLSYVLGRPLLRSLLWLMMAIGLVSGMVNAILVLWALESLGVAEAYLGVFLLALAAGGVVGSQTVVTMSGRLGRGRTLRLTLLAGSVSSLVAAATTSPYVAGIGVAGVGWSIVAFNVVNVSLRQRLAPEAMLGRVTATFRSGGVSVMLVGAVVGGAVASTAGLRLPWLLCGVGCLAIVAGTARRLSDEAVQRALVDAEAEPRSEPPAPRLSRDPG